MKIGVVSAKDDAVSAKNRAANIEWKEPSISELIALNVAVKVITSM